MYFPDERWTQSGTAQGFPGWRSTALSKYSVSPRSGRADRSHCDRRPIERANNSDALTRYFLESDQVALEQINSVAINENELLTCVHTSECAFGGRLAHGRRMLGAAVRV